VDFGSCLSTFCANSCARLWFILIQSSGQGRGDNLTSMNEHEMQGGRMA
jgi:hypothetical protein